ncbi:MAG: hypothetical protein ACOY5V_13225 [Pseudomonadota bacterium]
MSANQRLAFAARMTQIDAEAMQMLESVTFDVACLEPSRRGFAVVAA